MGAFGNLRPGLGLGQTGRVVYEPEATALFLRFTTPPTGARKIRINNLIRTLKSGGGWAKLDAFYVLAAANAQASGLNWIADAYNLTPVNSPTFTADRGYTGNGSSSYLNTGYNPTTAVGAKLALNSGHVAAWNLTSRSAAGTALIGSRNTAITSWIEIEPRVNVSGDKFVHRVNSGGGTTTANTSSDGYFVANRSGPSASQGFRNGVEVGSSTTSSLLIPNATIMLLARGTEAGFADALSSDQIAAASIGASLTADEVAVTYAALTAYLTGVGAI